MEKQQPAQLQEVTAILILRKGIKILEENCLRKSAQAEIMTQGSFLQSIVHLWKKIRWRK